MNLRLPLGNSMTGQSDKNQNKLGGVGEGSLVTGLGERYCCVGCRN